jgi:4-amino-4-deoxy-L-arabinose transferase-like glycosyltransferase
VPEEFPSAEERVLTSLVLPEPAIPPAPAAPFEGAPPEAEAFRRRLTVLTLLALAVRIGFLLAEPATRPVGDERTWTDWARELSSARVGLSPLKTHYIFYPPVYAYFLAVPHALTGGFAVAQWAQALVGALLVPAVGRVGARTFSPRVGLVAAAVAAFYPEIVWFSVHFWSETVFLVVLLWGWERLLAADGPSARWRTAVAAGLLWGLATLTRETVLYFIPLAAAGLAFRRGTPGRRQGAAFALAALVVVAPWTYRNWVALGAFVPVSTAGGQNLFQGNTTIPRDETYRMVQEVQGRVEQYRYAMRMGLEAIRDRQPWWIFEKLRDEMPRFWEADSLALIHIKRGAYGVVPPWAAVATAVVVLAPYVAVLALAVLGAAALRPDRAHGFLLAFLAYYNLLHVVTHGFARYRLPVMPVLFVFAASAWVAGRDARLGALVSGRRRVAAVALGALAVALLVPSFRLNLAHPAFALGDTGGSAGEAPGE